MAKRKDLWYNMLHKCEQNKREGLSRFIGADGAFGRIEHCVPAQLFRGGFQAKSHWHQGFGGPMSAECRHIDAQRSDVFSAKPARRAPVGLGMGPGNLN